MTPLHLFDRERLHAFSPLLDAILGSFSRIEPSQMQALNPALVMVLIPINNFFLYPTLERLGFRMTALRRMTAGIAFAGVAWIVVGGIQLVLDGGSAMSIGWQAVPYVS